MTRASESRGVSGQPVDMRRITRLWLPLAASWLLMGAEMPLFTIFIARMTEPKIHLAAFGSVVFPISLVVEGPVIMLLAASTALSRNWPDYLKLRRFMWVLAAGMTAVHLAVAFTPLYDLVARTWIGAPEEVIEPARIGLRIMTPWTAMIAYRRFQQGVLIRFERSRLVMAGTAARLCILASVLAIGSFNGLASGIVVGTSAVAAAVTVEALFVAWAVRPTLRGDLRRAPILDREAIGTGALLRFYIPLAMTPLITLLLQPAGAAAMSRMPLPLASLAAWPAVHGLVFLMRSGGFAFNEVVVALLGEPGAVPALRRFTWLLGLGTLALLLLIAVTPLAAIWFGRVSGLDAELTALSTGALLLAVLMPLYQALQSWYQGVLVHRKRTRGITEAVVVYLVVCLIALVAAARYGSWPGLRLALCAFTLGGIAQTAWLWWRCRSHLRELEGEEDSASTAG